MTFVFNAVRSAVFTTAAVLALSASAADFPLKSDDQNLNHRYAASTPAGGYLQTQAKNITAVRYAGNNKWSHLAADNSDPTLNANHLIYGRKVYAMVSGTVVGCWRNAPDNYRAGTKDADVINGYVGVFGNHVWIRTDDGVLALHAHLIPGSIASSICPKAPIRFNTPSLSGGIAPEAAVTNGVHITQGQYLGLAGNSGNSTAPHLHVQMSKDNAAVEMKFAHGQSAPFPNNSAQQLPSWTLLKGNPLPAGSVMVWAPRSTAYWTINGVSSAAFQGWFNHMVDSGQMAESLPCFNNGASYNTEWVPGKGVWMSQSGISEQELNEDIDALSFSGYKLYKSWACGPVRSAIWRK